MIRFYLIHSQYSCLLMILPEATLHVCAEVRCKSIYRFPSQESLTTKKLPFELNCVLSNVVNLYYFYLLLKFTLF